MFPPQVNPSPVKPERQEHVTSTPAVELKEDTLFCHGLLNKFQSKTPLKVAMPKF